MVGMVGLGTAESTVHEILLRIGSNSKTINKSGTKCDIKPKLTLKKKKKKR